MLFTLKLIIEMDILTCRVKNKMLFTQKIRLPLLWYLTMSFEWELQIEKENLSSVYVRNIIACVTSNF